MKKQNIPQKVSFLDAIKGFWTGYIDFNGRATRPQYWYAILFIILVDIISGILFGAIMQSVISAMLFLPMISVSVRRYHDVGISGWFYAAPVIVFTVWTALRENTWFTLLNFDYFAPDMIVFMIALLVFFVANLVICCMPSQKNIKKKK